MSGDRDLGVGPARGRPVRLEDVDREGAPAEVRARSATIYDGVRELLTLRGWIQGRETRGERLSLTAAIDVAVGADEAGGASGPRLARGGRIRGHLGVLAGTASLIAWNDDRGRRIGEVLELLDAAALAHPDD